MTTTSNIGDMPTTTASRGRFIRKFNWTEDLQANKEYSYERQVGDGFNSAENKHGISEEGAAQ